MAEVAIRATGESQVLVAVADSGSGIPPEDRQRIFEPGYSTEPAGHAGSRGVGIALVQRLVERRGGTIAVHESDLGGACFEVRLPAGIRPAAEVTT